MPSPKHSRPSSRIGSRAAPMPLSQRLQYTALVALVVILVVVYLATGESATKNSEFYKRTVALMQEKGQHPAAPAAAGAVDAAGNRVLPDKPLHRAGGLHFAEPEGHGSLQERRRGKKVQGPQALPDGMMGNPRHGGGDGVELDADGNPKPLMEDGALKGRLRQAEADAKRSADERYRGLADIEAEVDKDRVTRAADQKPLPRPTPADDDAAVDDSDAPPAPYHTPLEKSVAGRKKIPAAGDDNAAAAAAKQQGSPRYPTESHAPNKKNPPHDAAAADADADAETAAARITLAEILAKAPVTIFSKTSCPFSRKAKAILLAAHTITPAPHVVELNEHAAGPALQRLLMKTTGRATVPNVLVNGKSIGGGDETELLWKNGEIPARLKQMAGKRIVNVVANYAFGEAPPMQPPQRPAVA